MAMRTRRLSPLAAAAGIVLVLGAPSWAAQKGPKISVKDDPSVKEGSPGFVLVEVADFE